MRRSISLFVSAAAALALTGCGAFKDDAAADGGANDGSFPGDGASSSGGGSDAAGNGDANPSGGKDGAGNGDDGTGDSGPTPGNDAGSDGGALSTTGAGPFGDLPSGYCCTADTDCRNRHCATITGSVQMCEDECDGAQTLCNGLLPNFTCTASGDDGFCTPPAGTTTCTPAAQYVHGTKAIGACCSATGDATSGQECIGGNCGATGADSNPFICENACTSGKDCPPGNYECQPIAEYSLCIPLATHYTCQ
jgi:hypothetical protein